MKILTSCGVVALAILGCDAAIDGNNGNAEQAAQATQDESAARFVGRINDELKELSMELGAAGWVRATCITRTPQYYFQPLMTWLEEQNKGRSCGW